MILNEGRWMNHPENLIYAAYEVEKSFSLFGEHRAEQVDLVRLNGDDRFSDKFTRFLWGPCLAGLEWIRRNFFVSLTHFAAMI
jgi:hypothetical protein